LRKCPTWFLNFRGKTDEKNTGKKDRFFILFHIWLKTYKTIYILSHPQKQNTHGRRKLNTVPLISFSIVPIVLSVHYTFVVMFQQKKLSSMIKKKKWKKVLSFLNTNAGAKQVHDIDTMGQRSSVLSLAVFQKAPIEIIRAILQTMPTISLMADKFGYLPIHHACALGLRTDIIEFLVDHDHGASARALTSYGNSPLHLIVGSICIPRGERNTPQYSQPSSCKYSADDEDADMIDYFSNGSGDSSLSMNQSALNKRMASIEYLCMVAPEMVRFVNKGGLTPIDLLQEVKAESIGAQWERADIAYQGLRKVNIQLYKDQKKLYELSRERAAKEGLLPSIISSVTSSTSSSFTVSTPLSERS